MFDVEAIYEAKTVSEAVKLRQEHPEAVVIAGGSDVLIKIREGRLAGCELISIYGIDALRGVRMEENGTLRIGSLTSFSHITRDPLIQEHIAVLGEAVDKVGGPQIRAIGTIGGNTCNGVTSADSASTLFAWDAVIELTGPEGIRKVPIEAFYLGAGRVDLREGEIQTGILIPRESWEDCQGHYIKYGMRNAMEIATTGCSVNVRLSPDKKTVRRLRIGYGVAAPIPIRAHKTEAAWRDKPVSEETAQGIAKSVLEDVTPRDSWRASKDMRLHLCSEMAYRAFAEAVRRCGGDI
ncbi:MAG: xanthine dehydrogenase FAD-binding subunit XdhB [Fretibacterium sp.]|nr:xanthine dehydrogenase FAD-binding subunit XdhB [Fretibacterium sp.]